MRIETVYMPSGPELHNFDERTRWAKFAANHEPDEPFKLDPSMTNAQYGYRADRILEADRCLVVSHKGASGKVRRKLP